MPVLTYTISPYVPFSKILSANINQDKTDIKNKFNWSGTPGDATTGIDSTNIQSYTAVAEVVATLTLGGVTYTALPGFATNGNSITIQYTAGGIAGSEVVTVTGLAISIQISSGVSTITQVRTAVNASVLAAALVTATGTSATTVATAGPSNLAGGVAGGGLIRSTKLALDAASWVVINNSSGQQSSEAALAAIRGGTGLQVVPATQNAGDVLQINATKTAFTLGTPTAVPASLKLYQFYNIS